MGTECAAARGRTRRAGTRGTQRGSRRPQNAAAVQQQHTADTAKRRPADIYKASRTRAGCKARRPRRKRRSVSPASSGQPGGCPSAKSCDSELLARCRPVRCARPAPANRCPAAHVTPADTGRFAPSAPCRMKAGKWPAFMLQGSNGVARRGCGSIGAVAADGGRSTCLSYRAEWLFPRPPCVSRRASPSPWSNPNCSPNGTSQTMQNQPPRCARGTGTRRGKYEQRTRMEVDSINQWLTPSVLLASCSSRIGFSSAPLCL